VIILSGCFHYVPAPLPEAPQGTPVRVILERPGPFELSGFTVHDVQRIEGEFVTRDERGLFLSATWLEAVSGQGFAGGGWTVRIEEEAMRSMEIRRVSWLKSGIVAAGIAIGSYLGFDAIRGSSGRDGQSGGGTRPQ